MHTSYDDFETAGCSSAASRFILFWLSATSAAFRRRYHEVAAGRFGAPYLLPVCDCYRGGGSSACARRRGAEGGARHGERCFSARPRRREVGIAADGTRSANAAQLGGEAGGSHRELCAVGPGSRSYGEGVQSRADSAGD